MVVWGLIRLLVRAGTAVAVKLVTTAKGASVALAQRVRWPGDEVRIRKEGAAVILEPPADWQWLDDVAGKFSEDFLRDGRNQPRLPPQRDMGPVFE